MLASASRTTLQRTQKTLWTLKSPKYEPAALHILESGQWRHAHSATAEEPPHLNLQSQPWRFTPDNTVDVGQRRTTLARYNMQLSKHAETGGIVEAIMQCKQMKDAGVKPDINTYNHLLQAIASASLPLEAWAVMDDMALLGIKPNRTSFHHLLNAQRHSDARHMWSVMDKMSDMSILPNATTFSIIMSRYIATENVELALQYLFDMNGRGLVCELNTVQAIIILTARSGSPRLALDIATSFEDGSVRKLDAEVWMNCLIYSAGALDADGVTQCWEKVVQEFSITPDEGTCIEVLHTAARHGLPDLATDVLRVLKLMGIAWQEYHFAPLIEAFCRAGRIKDAVVTLDIMRSGGILPDAETAHPILTAISHDIDAVDATWTIIEDIHKEGKPIDISALNVIIQAAVSLGDLQRAVGTYKAYPDYNLKPTVETYNLLFVGCVTTGHRELGDRLLAEMKEAGVKPNRQTYENLICLCLTQTTYEDAFFYLEEMKATHLPTLRIYETLVRTCVAAGDARYTLALEEMQECGYEVSRDLQVLTRPNPNGNQSR